MAPDVHPTPSSQEAAPPRRRILLCYDGSAEAKHALERVGEIASAVPSQVTVVSVAEPIYAEPRYAGVADPSEKQSHRRLLEEAAEELRGRGVDATTIEQVGQPAAAILDAARDGADLVVVGSRHRGLIKRLLFGSVSARARRRGAVRRAGRALRRCDRMEASWGENARDRRFLLASALRPEEARRSAAELPDPIDLVVTSPTERARQAAASAVGDRWVFTLEEPLLAPRVSGESGGDVLARFAQALRGVRASKSSVSLVMCDTLDLLGGSLFVLDEKGLMHVADALDQLPLLD